MRAKLFFMAARGAALLSGITVVGIFIFLLQGSLPILRHRGIIPFFHDRSWHPLEQQFGILPMIAATLAVSAGALLLAAPLGVGIACFQKAYAPPFAARILRRVLGLLAGIPSVVYGLFGLVILVPLMAKIHPPGANLLTGVLILATMILPTVALTAEAHLNALPTSLQWAAEALGVSKWGALREVFLPAASLGIRGGLLLALGRALGETMALLMVTGNVVAFPHLFSPIRTLPANIALEMAFALGDHRAALMVCGLILFFLTLVSVVAARQTAPKRVSQEASQEFPPAHVP